MKNSNKFFLILSIIFMLIVFSINVMSDILVKVGVIDKEKIYEIYKTKPLVDIKMAFLTDSFNEKAIEYHKELNDLKNKMNSSDIEEYERENMKEQYDNLYNEARSLYEYTKRKLNDLKENREKYIEEDIKYAIRKVAEREGYSIILDIHSDFLIYYSETVDLTNLVLEYLQDYILKYCNENGIDIDKYVLGKEEDNYNENDNNVENNVNSNDVDKNKNDNKEGD